MRRPSDNPFVVDSFPPAKPSRRGVLKWGAASVVGGGVSVLSPSLNCAANQFQPDPNLPKALVFDVFGTVTDWRLSIIREGQLLGERKGLQVDWGKFADAWRAGYLPIMDRVRRGELGWTKIDRLHRMILDNLLDQFAIRGLEESEIFEFNRVWHRLIPWPDTVSGLNRLRSRYIVAALSNGNMSLLINLSKNAGLPWDCVLSAELSGKYFKPDKEVYQTASEFLDLPPGEIMMVTTHDVDMQGALNAGFRVAYVHRPLELGLNVKPPFDQASAVEIVANDFVDLARQLKA